MEKAANQYASNSGVTTKNEQLDSIGISKMQASRYETLAKHPEMVEQAKADARERGENEFLRCPLCSFVPYPLEKAFLQPVKVQKVLAPGRGVFLKNIVFVCCFGPFTGTLFVFRFAHNIYPDLKAGARR